jgi:hypothetical protein
MIPSSREITSHRIESAAQGIMKNLAAVVYSPRRLFQGALLGLAAHGAVTIHSAAPSVEAAAPVASTPESGLFLNDPNCLGFSFPQNGPIVGAMEMNGTRDYILVDAANRPVRNITDELPGSTTVYDKLSDLDDSVVGTVQGLPPTFTDYQVRPTSGGNTEIMRTRYAEGDDTTEGYWIQKGVKKPGEYDSVGNRMVFTANRIDGPVEAKTACGTTMMVDGFDVEKSQIFAGGRLAAVRNGIQRIARNCVFFDHMTWTIRLREPQQSEVPPVVTPKPEEQTETPAQMPIRPVPGSYNVQMPLR